MSITYKRFCKTLELKNDPDLITNYKKVHASEAAWPEITQGMKEVGIVDMEIYLLGNRLFMIMDTVDCFDHDSAMAELAKKKKMDGVHISGDNKEQMGSLWLELNSRGIKTEGYVPSEKDQQKLAERMERKQSNMKSADKVESINNAHKESQKETQKERQAQGQAKQQEQEQKQAQEQEQNRRKVLM